MRRIAVAALAVLAVSGTISSATENKYVTSQMTVACNNLPILAQMVKYLADEDTKAFFELLAAAYATGECRGLKTGTIVYVDSMNIAVANVRPRGEHGTYWVLSKMLEKKD